MKRLDVLDLKGRPWDLVAAVFLKLIPKHADAGVDGLTEAERTVFTVWEFLGEVSNGGVDQYFSNSSGSRAGIAVKSLKRIGAAAHRDLAEAVKLRPAKESEAPGERAFAARDEIVEKLARYIVKNVDKLEFTKLGLDGFRAGDGIVGIYGKIAKQKKPSKKAWLWMRAVELCGTACERGFAAYFHSQYGNFARAVAALYDAIGAKPAAAVVRKALACLPAGATMAAARRKALTPEATAALAPLQYEFEDQRDAVIAGLLAARPDGT